MRKANKALSAVLKSRPARSFAKVSYVELAGGLAEEMADRVGGKRRQRFCAPFELVIVDCRGAVVFAGEVGENWNVRPGRVARVVRRSHFPATALLTDRSQLTRTFQIERANGA